MAADKDENPIRLLIFTYIYLSKSPSISIKQDRESFKKATIFLNLARDFVLLFVGGGLVQIIATSSIYLLCI